MRTYLTGTNPSRHGAGDLVELTMAIDINTYFRGLAADRLRELGDTMLALSREAEEAAAHMAALHLADIATQLEDIAREAAPESTQTT
jgi:hypothetical protein